jgi:hypothetical protein
MEEEIELGVVRDLAQSPSHECFGQDLKADPTSSPHSLPSPFCSISDKSRDMNTNRKYFYHSGKPLNTSSTQLQ